MTAVQKLLARFGYEPWQYLGANALRRETRI
jgi:hypothetical protein